MRITPTNIKHMAVKPADQAPLIIMPEKATVACQCGQQMTEITHKRYAVQHATVIVQLLL